MSSWLSVWRLPNLCETDAERRSLSLDVDGDGHPSRDDFVTDIVEHGSAATRPHRATCWMGSPTNDAVEAVMDPREVVVDVVVA